MNWDRALTTIKGGHRAAFLLALVVALQSAKVLAHGDEKPAHGGIMGRGDDSVTVEFVYNQGMLLVYVEDHDGATPLLAQNLKGAWVSVFGPGRPAQQARLVPSGENRLTASGLTPRVGDRMNVRLILPNGIETWSVVTFREARR